jgi:arylsulfatase A-like enzyme
MPCAFFLVLTIDIDLKKIGEADNTLIVVTADHGHGFVSFCSHSEYMVA